MTKRNAIGIQRRGGRGEKIFAPTKKGSRLGGKDENQGGRGGTMGRCHLCLSPLLRIKSRAISSPPSQGGREDERIILALRRGQGVQCRHQPPA